MGRVIGYARVSTERQSEDSEALEQQIARLKIAGATEIFKDVQSGSKDNRPEFKKVMKLVEKVEVDTVIFTRLDRMSRKTETILKTVAEFESKGVHLVVLDQKIDTTTSYGEFQLTVMAGLARMETAGLSERIKHGWNHVIENKKARHAPFGYRVQDDKYVLNDTFCEYVPESLGAMSYAEVAKDWIDTFFEKRSIHATVLHINRKYGIDKAFEREEKNNRTGAFGFSQNGFKAWITNPVLMGHTINRRWSKGKIQDQDKWSEEKDTHPDQTLLTASQLAKIEEVIRINKEKAGYRQTKHNRPLTGLVVCSVCKGGCHFISAGTGTKTDKKNFYYQCSKGKEGCPNNKRCRVDKIEPKIIQALFDYQCGRYDAAYQEQKEEDSRLPILRQQLEGMQAVLKIAPNPAIENSVRQVQNQIKAIEEQQHIKDLDSLEKENFAHITSALFKYLESPSDKDAGTSTKESLFDAESIPMLRKLIKEIRINDAQVESVHLHAEPN